MIWPGTFSKASAALPKGGTAMLALLALGDDLGCARSMDLFHTFFYEFHTGFVSEDTAVHA